MSNNINQALIERANEAMEYWTGTMWERVIERDLATHDLEALRYHLNEAEKEMSIQEDSIMVDIF